MKNKLVLGCLSLGLLSSLSYADEFKISTAFLSMDYVETSKNGTFLDSEKSDFNEIAGLELGYKFIFENGHGGANESALELLVEYVQGESRYDGFLQSGGVIISKYETKTDNRIIEPCMRWIETKKSDAYDVSVFVSLGYRDWVRDMSSDIYGIKETYRWAYGGVGMNLMFHDENWHIGLQGDYKKAFLATMNAEFNGGMDFDLGDTWGYSVKVPLIWDISQAVSFELSYKHDTWEIGASNVVQGYYEPDSKTNNEIIKLGLVFKW
jgi:hypothetical protein